MAAVNEIAEGINNHDVGDGIDIGRAPGKRELRQRGEHKCSKRSLGFIEVGKGLLCGIIKRDDNDLQTAALHHVGIFGNNFGHYGTTRGSPRGCEEVHVVLRMWVGLMRGNKRRVLDSLRKRRYRRGSGL